MLIKELIIENDEIISLIRKINANKATSSEGISVKILLLCDDFGILPEMWKLANPIPPHYKKEFVSFFEFWVCLPFFPTIYIFSIPIFKSCLEQNIPIWEHWALPYIIAYKIINFKGLYNYQYISIGNLKIKCNMEISTKVNQMFPFGNTGHVLLSYIV